MKKVSIITDSDASLTPDLEKKYNIRQVPITVHFDDEVLETNIDIDDPTLIKRISEEGRLPTTAAPPPGKFAEAYQKAFSEDQADAVLCFTVSGKVSATYDAARIAAEEIMPDKDITVVDSLSLSAGQAFMCMTAADALNKGNSIEEAIRAAEEIRERTSLFGALATLKYLAMGGRVNQLTAGMAGMLNIKPILTINDGKLDMLEKVRTRKKAWGRAIELVTADVGVGKIEVMSIIHTDALEEAAGFESLLRENITCPEDILLLPLSAGLSVHTGPGFVGVCYIKAA